MDKILTAMTMQLGLLTLLATPTAASAQTLYHFWSAPQNLALEDLTGDGYSDVFRASGSNWYLSESGTESWGSPINSHNDTLEDIGFGDFDGDGQTDVFRSTGTSWQVSWSGTSSWQTLNNTDAGDTDLLGWRCFGSVGYVLCDQVPDLFFEDFDGDGETDVFYADGSNWFISWSGITDFDLVNTSGFRPHNANGDLSLLFGDFDGNGTTDVFRSGSQWKVSYGAWSGWSSFGMAGSNASITQLSIADVDGDGESDVVRMGGNGSRWQVSYSGGSSWSTLASSRTEVVDDVAWGRFDRGISDDAMRTTGGQWSVSFGGTTSWTYLNTSGFRL